MGRPRIMFVAAAMTAVLSLVPSASAFGDDADTQFIGEVSFFLRGNYLDPPTISALIGTAKTVCAMSDAGFSDEAMEFINSTWDPWDPSGFMLASTKAYCPEHAARWSGL